MNDTLNKNSFSKVFLLWKNQGSNYLYILFTFWNNNNISPHMIIKILLEKVSEVNHTALGLPFLTLTLKSEQKNEIWYICI